MSGPPPSPGPARTPFLQPAASPDSKPLTCALCPFASPCPRQLELHQATHPSMSLYPDQQPHPPPVKREPPSPWWPLHGDPSWDPPSEPLLPQDELGYKVVVVGGGEEGGGRREEEEEGGSRAAVERPPPTSSLPPRHRWQSKQYQCDLCPYVARGKQDLRVHEREQHLREGSDVIQCSQCSYSTNKISFWRQHKLVHLGSAGATGRIYMCKTCGWKTKYRHSLVKHIALHTGNKSFQCDQCGFACARKENLKRHKLTHLKKGVDGKGLMLKCGWCEYATAHSNALRRHAVTLHNADENYVPEYQCDVCDFRTTKLSNFSNHKITHLYAGYMMVQVNQTGPLKCSLCPFVSDHWDCLQEHQRTHKELRCIQDLLGVSEAEGAQPPTPEARQAGDSGQEEEEERGSELGAPESPSGKPDDIVALRKIIGTIGEYVNGDGGPCTEPAGLHRRPCGGWRRRWRSVGGGAGVGATTGAPPGGWEVAARLAPGRRFRCPDCRFACHRKEGLRRHLSSHKARRLTEEGQRGPEGQQDSNQQADPEQGREGAGERTPPASSPRVSEPQEAAPPELQPAPPLSEHLALERERLALERERLALEREKWQAQRGVLALQEHKLRLQVLLLERQLNFKNQT